MAKGSAKESSMGALHALLAQVFTKSLEAVEEDLTLAERAREIALLDLDDLDTEDALDVANALKKIAGVLGQGCNVNPALLSAVAKFLKDNDISFDEDDIEELSALEKRLKDKERKRRQGRTTLDNLPVTGHA